jgi:thiamine monophosphate kinase
MHILEASAEPLVAELHTDAIPIAADVVSVFGAERALEYALTGGDEYCLLCTLPAGVTPSVPAEAIGELVKAERAGLLLDGAALPSDWQLGWDHSR